LKGPCCFFLPAQWPWDKTLAPLYGLLAFYVTPIVVGLDLGRYHWSPLGLWSAILGTALFALIPAALAILVLVVRTSLEDKTLQRELTGYAAYTQQVPHRLLPYLW